MNRHFNDAMYYARRTAESIYNGLRDELEPYVDEATERYYDYRGIEQPEEPTRIALLQSELDDLEAREVIQTVKHRFGGKRSQQ